MGKLLSFVLGVTAALWILPGVQVDHSAWHIASYKAGREDALSLNPVSWDLDAACVSLWVSQQNLVEAPK
jgi:hypothetical protein